MGIDELIAAFWMYPALAMFLVLAVAVGYFVISLFRGSKKSGSKE
jgi:hypothetical protein